MGRSEDTILEFPVKLDPDTLRGNYETNVKISLGNNLMIDKLLSYSVQEYQELKQLTLPETRFLLTGETVTFENTGNTPVTQTLTRVFGWFSYKFASFNPEPSSVEKTDEGYVVKWDLNVPAQSNKSVNYAVNYRLPIVILLIIIIALLVWYVVRQRNAVVVVKRVFAMHTETGSVKVMKVLINVRNRGGLTVNNLRIVDRVPSAIKSPTQHGMLRPSHVKAVPDGTILVWDLPSVKPGEEKIISYRIEGKINAMGKLVLPATVAKYLLLGRAVTARSSTVSLTEKK